MISKILEYLEKTFEETTKYTKKSKLQKSGYFVKEVEYEIGRVAFMNDYEITKIEIENIKNLFFGIEA